MASLQKQIYHLVGLERLRLKPDAKVGSLVNLAMRRSSLDALHVFVIFRKAGPRKTVRMISQAWAAKQMNDRDHFKLSHGPALKNSSRHRESMNQSGGLPKGCSSHLRAAFKRS